MTYEQKVKALITITARNMAELATAIQMLAQDMPTKLPGPAWYTSSSCSDCTIRVEIVRDD